MTETRKRRVFRFLTIWWLPILWIWIFFGILHLAGWVDPNRARWERMFGGTVPWWSFPYIASYAWTFWWWAPVVIVSSCKNWLDEDIPGALAPKKGAKQ